MIIASTNRRQAGWFVENKNGHLNSFFVTWVVFYIWSVQIHKHVFKYIEEKGHVHKLQTCVLTCKHVFLAKNSVKIVFKLRLSSHWEAKIMELIEKGKQEIGPTGSELTFLTDGRTKMLSVCMKKRNDFHRLNFMRSIVKLRSKEVSNWESLLRLSILFQTFLVYLPL